MSGRWCSILEESSNPLETRLTLDLFVTSNLSACSVKLFSRLCSSDHNLTFASFPIVHIQSQNPPEEAMLLALWFSTVGYPEGVLFLWFPVEWLPLPGQRLLCVYPTHYCGDCLWNQHANAAINKACSLEPCKGSKDHVPLFKWGSDQRASLEWRHIFHTLSSSC